MLEPIEMGPVQRVAHHINLPIPKQRFKLDDKRLLLDASEVTFRSPVMQPKMFVKPMSNNENRVIQTMLLPPDVSRIRKRCFKIVSYLPWKAS